jgi:hypothetical protein
MSYNYGEVPFGSLCGSHSNYTLVQVEDRFEGAEIVCILKAEGGGEEDFLHRWSIEYFSQNLK